GQRADPDLLGLGGHQVLLVLQAVARADLADVHFAHGERLRSKRPTAMPAATPTAASASITCSEAPQPPARAAIQATRTGMMNWASCDACMIMPLVVPMCCALRACTGATENTAGGISPPSTEKASAAA